MKMVFIKKDSVTIIGWIQDKMKQCEIHPLLYDIWKYFYSFMVMYVHYVFRKMNNAID